MAETLDRRALTTVAHLRSHLARSRTSETTGQLDDDTLTLLINHVSAAIEGHCGRSLIAPAADQTITIAGDGLTQIALYRYGRYPIVSITSITCNVSGVTIPARLSATGVGYVIADAEKLAGIIRLDGYTTDRDSEGTTIIGRWGYDATTAALATWIGEEHSRALQGLERACLQWCSLLAKAPTGAQDSMAIGDLSLTVEPREIPREVEKLLRPYRRLP